ncbi:MAG: bacteriocin-protection protein [Bacteroidetes bacterium GWF2_49_14]|nr:MAG: bacteriocin-protection protein [Bacteroidetes bacterium GWF2_49_14]HBB93563.1 bacteriocin-protection protein [Bacteroidales bacterium]
MDVVFFATQHEFRRWLEEHHQTETELLVGYYKLGSGKPSITWSESVDQALCFGWIDGVRRSIDAESYCNRFTPRKSSSNWSTINIKKVEEITRAGLMAPAGLLAFSKRKTANSEIYSYENELAVLSPEFEARFKKNQSAWEFFNTQAPSYRKTRVHWILSAKQEETRLSRIDKLIEVSKNKQRLY